MGGSIVQDYTAITAWTGRFHRGPVDVEADGTVPSASVFSPIDWQYTSFSYVTLQPHPDNVRCAEQKF